MALHKTSTRKKPTAKDLRKEINPPTPASQKRKMPKDKDASVRLQRDS